MTNFLSCFYDDIGNMVERFIDIFKAIISFFTYVFNFEVREEIITNHQSAFDTMDWVMLVASNILVLVFIVLLFIALIRLIKKTFKLGVTNKKYEEVKSQVAKLQRDLIRANQEKDKLLAMRAAELGIGPEVEEETEDGEEIESNRNTVDSPCVNPEDSRFFRLTNVDNYYKEEYKKPQYEQNINLEEFCERFRLYAASQLKLYYDINIIRFFVASFGTTRIIILQGISGTGKTSLPYAFGKFVKRDTTVVSVQPAWRERSELYGYYNEFTKKYTETEFLRAIYEANYHEDPHIIILDEMNIARVEYYFAEMLSILEMPIQSEWKIDIASATWDNDPCLIEKGKVSIPNNVWFVGTINNDDSTFAVADKVYDRAIPIDLDNRAEIFECDEADNMYISTEHLNELFEQAKEDYQISQANLDRIEEMNAYVIKNFKLAFGNRIMKQLGDYVSCLMASGGAEMQAIDFMIAKKVLRKFESLSLGFMKDELTKLEEYFDELFGKDTMPISKEYIEILKKSN
ncbi:MAG: AAA family ATPase [Clostridia bacterium]